MIEIYDYNGDDFKSVMQFDGWKIGFLRYSERFSKFACLERHLNTDEAFALLDGNAYLYTEDEKIKMQKCKLYNIKKGEWHHITVSEDATVLVIENADTSKANTEKRTV